MGLLQLAIAATVVAAGWFLAVGTIRLLAYRSGSVDHTAGMRFVALMSLGLGAVALAALLVLLVFAARG